MNKKDYLAKTAQKIRIVFYVLLLITVYEIFYWLNHGGSLSFILVALAGAVTFFSYTLMKFFEDMRDDIE
ncbi:hypothetical protein A3I41_05500 [Candidatus Uhrbacteria bacterium RIFCSPLOWO2_02_FULL_48_18]|uniref:Uncharacterized protein n=1 Tax=Candidatus Uhrbacteria bacterium RIFCSPLOWO2_02_FULL_48_18 TaxID=1802408 RepID=A0A1F7V8H8_9BACT|nr:MAG: hypothetical protein A3B20_00730 [Candidatus Uhrbacteria bacterium RIFCSPLOWO2_01_FULL_47_17]OGL86751.1 MAG: hypothetical protein A3I41_05500 [Candidatus Uhrbacteria bacterium RIFCSPLOWO2_02_FULL_48_18]